MIIEINEIQGLNELRTWMFGLGLASYSIYSLIKSIADYRYNRQHINYIKRINSFGYDKIDGLYKNELEDLLDD